MTIQNMCLVLDDTATEKATDYSPLVVPWAQSIHQYEDDPEAWLKAAMETEVA